MYMPGPPHYPGAPMPHPPYGYYPPQPFYGPAPGSIPRRASFMVLHVFICLDFSTVHTVVSLIILELDGQCLSVSVQLMMVIMLGNANSQ
jgi:hypothetical protein